MCVCVRDCGADLLMLLIHAVPVASFLALQVGPSAFNPRLYLLYSGVPARQEVELCSSGRPLDKRERNGGTAEWRGFN